MSFFRSQVPKACQIPSLVPAPLLALLALDTAGSLDGAVQVYFAAGLAKSSHRTYKTAGKRYMDFCRDFALNPFPVTEPILCYFVACLGQQGLAPTTIKTYLSGVHQMQIAAGYPDINLSLQPRLHQVLKGVETTAQHMGSLSKATPHLPITPNILRKMPGAVRGP